MNRTLSFEQLTDAATSLADLIINKYTSTEGGIFEKVNVIYGKIVSSDCAIDELGDYIQYIIYLSKLTSNKAYEDWGLKAIRSMAQSYQSEKGLFYNQKVKHPLRTNLLTINNADTITGLVSSYLYTGSDLLKPIIEKFIDGVFRSFSDDGYLTYGYLLYDKLKISLSSLLFSGYFIEEVLYYMESDNNRDYLPKIKHAIDRNLSNRFYAKYGLFQARIPLGVRGACLGLLYLVLKKDNLKTTFLVKDNVYFIFALLKYYDMTRDVTVKEIITRLYHRLMALFKKDGIFFNNWNPSKGLIGAPSGLALSHSLIELQLDLYHELGDEIYLQDAVELTGRWLQRKSQFEVINESIDENRHYSLLDPNVDFAIDLIKLTEKTGDGHYRKEAFRIAGGILEYFKAPRGYYWKIDTITGNPLQSDIETKYLGLLIKLFIVLSKCHDGRSIFGDAIIRNLSRDR